LEIGNFMCWSGCDCLNPSTMEKLHGECAVIAPPSCVRLAIGLQVTTSKSSRVSQS
jgi:hypothetical protein